MEESTLLKRLLILKCISSPQSKDVGKIEFFAWKEMLELISLNQLLLLKETLT